MTETPDIEKLLLDLRSDDWKLIKPAIESFGLLTDTQESDKAFHQLVVMLDEPNPWIRQRVVSALGALDGRRAIEVLINRLDDHEEEMLDTTLGVLVRFKDPKAIAPLIHQLDRMDFKLALNLLAFGDAVLNPLMDALKDSSASIRAQAAYLLGNSKDIRALDALIACLDDENFIVRQNVIASLMWIGSKRAIPALTSHTQDADARIREAIARALSKLNDM
jgi:HEAT repeat protein